MRFRVSVVVAALTLVSCSSSSDAEDGAGAAEPLSDVTEFPFDKPLGSPPAYTLKAKPFEEVFTWTPAPKGDGYFIHLGDRILKRGKGPVTDPEVWSGTVGPFEDGASLGEVTYPFPTADGGVMVLSDVGSHPAVIALAAGGSVRWTRRFPDLGRSQAGAVLSNGGFAFVASTEPGPGSIEDKKTYLFVLAADGKDAGRGEIAPIHVASADHPGGGTPGTSLPTIRRLAPTADGGVAAVGECGFTRILDCSSTTEEPKEPTPSGSKCANSSGMGYVARFDAAGKEVWSKVIGQPYRSSQPSLGSIGVGGDGSILVAGYLKMNADPGFGPSQAIAMRFDDAGHQLFSKSFPFGKAPGVSLAVEATSFEGVVPRANGAFDMIMHAPGGELCRLVRIEADGTLSQVQKLDELDTPNPERTAQMCTVTSGPDALGYVVFGPALAQVRAAAVIAP